MTKWFRQIPFSADHGHEWSERWEYRPNGITERSFEILVKAGKPLDVLSLKGCDLDEVRNYADFLEKTAKKIYGSSLDAPQLRGCPICGGNLDNAAIELTVFAVSYMRCSLCGHVCIPAHPAQEVLDDLFTASESHSYVYIDRRTLETRMTQIVLPKLEWCREIFRRRSGHMPESIVDVGAGGGHFLAGALRCGLKIEGFEFSGTSRSFAREAFGVHLREDDFLTASCGPADMVTYWGLLEYVLRPRDFIAAARRRLTPKGMLVIEVPRVDSLGTLVQAMDCAVVARHMDPTTHVNGFTDESICTMLVEEGFAPVAAWYFGMDAYEVCVQIALRGGDVGLFATLADFIPVVQRALDRGRQCDDIIIAAVPMENS
ncbi:MAG: methyltransferase domain-containing protein [Desulfobacteraceae bacterium]|nr:MAG: methyltransferase domain-containing protein [Desulfobacteraceae bacterium]